MAVQYLLNIQYLDDGLQFVACIFSRLSSSILEVPYLLHEHPMALLAPTNHPQMKCEKTQINNCFGSTLDEDVPYSIVVKNITAEETRDMFKTFAVHFVMFFLHIIYLIIYSIRSIWKSLKQHFYVSSEAEIQEVFCEKGVIRYFAKSTGKHLRQRLFFNRVSKNTVFTKHFRMTASTNSETCFEFQIHVKKVLPKV